MRFPRPKLTIKAGFPTALIMLTLPVWSVGTQTAMIHGAAIAVILGASIILHEYAHAYAGFRCGVMPEKIVLHWLGGAATFARQPYTRRDRILVTIAGPAVNLAVALVGYLLQPFAATPAVLWSFEALANLNLGLCLFNLLPAIPLDGGRVLYLLIGGRWGEATAMRVVGLLGTIVGALAVAFMLISILTGFFILLPIDPRQNWRLYRKGNKQETGKPAAATAE